MHEIKLTKGEAELLITLIDGRYESLGVEDGEDAVLNSLENIATRLIAIIDIKE